jgi:hypothetical protein
LKGELAEIGDGKRRVLAGQDTVHLLRLRTRLLLRRLSLLNISRSLNLLPRQQPLQSQFYLFFIRCLAPSITIPEGLAFWVDRRVHLRARAGLDSKARMLNDLM